MNKPTYDQLAERVASLEAALGDILPGAYYMDPPDGGSVDLIEQVRRMADDATKWREAESGKRPMGYVDGRPVFVGSELEQRVKDGWVRHNAQASWVGVANHIDWNNDLRWPALAAQGDAQPLARRRQSERPRIEMLPVLRH